MFDVGFAELFLLALIGLLVLGPERLPGVARTIGGFIRKARTSWISLRNTIESELAEADITDPVRQARDELKRIGEDLPAIPGITAKNHQPGTPESHAATTIQHTETPADKTQQPVARDTDPDA